jgi:hypothetical protein
VTLREAERAPGAAARFLRMQPSDISGIVSAGAPVVSLTVL